MNNKIIYGLVAVTVLAGGYLYWSSIDKGEKISGGLRVCPEAWYENRMPGPVGGSDLPKEYFVVEGERVEVKDMDVEWVKENCEVKSPQPVF